FLMKLLKKEVRIKGHFDIKGIILMSVGIVFFMLFTTSYSISFLIVSVLSFLIFVKHIRKVTDPFVDHGLGKNIPFMIGVLCGGIIFGTVAGFVSFLLETTLWFMTIIIVFVLGQLSFTISVISTFGSSSLQPQEAGAGMSLLSFTSLLSE